MTPEQIELIDTLTYAAFIMLILILISSSINLRKTKKQLNDTDLLVDRMVIMSKEMVEEHGKILAYNGLKHCGMDIDECTVTIVFDTKEQTIDFLDSHESKSRIKMVHNGKVIPFCESCEDHF